MLQLSCNCKMPMDVQLDLLLLQVILFRPQQGPQPPTSSATLGSAPPGPSTLAPPQPTALPPDSYAARLGGTASVHQLAHQPQLQQHLQPQLLQQQQQQAVSSRASEAYATGIAAVAPTLLPSSSLLSLHAQPASATPLARPLSAHSLLVAQQHQQQRPQLQPGLLGAFSRSHPDLTALQTAQSTAGQGSSGFGPQQVRPEHDLGGYAATQQGSLQQRPASVPAGGALPIGPGASARGFGLVGPSHPAATLQAQGNLVPQPGSQAAENYQLHNLSSLAHGPGSSAVGSPGYGQFTGASHYGVSGNPAQPSYGGTATGQMGGALGQFGAAQGHLGPGPGQFAAAQGAGQGLYGRPDLGGSLFAGRSSAAGLNSDTGSYHPFGMQAQPGAGQQLWQGCTLFQHAASPVYTLTKHWSTEQVLSDCVLGCGFIHHQQQLGSCVSGKLYYVLRVSSTSPLACQTLTGHVSLSQHGAANWAKTCKCMQLLERPLFAYMTFSQALSSFYGASASWHVHHVLNSEFLCPAGLELASHFASYPTSLSSYSQAAPGPYQAQSAHSGQLSSAGSDRASPALGAGVHTRTNLAAQMGVGSSPNLQSLDGLGLGLGAQQGFGLGLQQAPQPDQLTWQQQLLAQQQSLQHPAASGMSHGYSHGYSHGTAQPSGFQNHLGHQLPPVPTWQSHLPGQQGQYGGLQGFAHPPEQVGYPSNAAQASFCCSSWSFWLLGVAATCCVCCRCSAGCSKLVAGTHVAWCSGSVCKQVLQMLASALSLQSPLLSACQTVRPPITSVVCLSDFEASNHLCRLPARLCGLQSPLSSACQTVRPSMLCRDLRQTVVSSLPISPTLAPMPGIGNSSCNMRRGAEMACLGTTCLHPMGQEAGAAWALPPHPQQQQQIAGVGLTPSNTSSNQRGQQVRLSALCTLCNQLYPSCISDIGLV